VAGAAAGGEGPIACCLVSEKQVVARLRAAGCVFAEDEARLLEDAARTPAELDEMVERRVEGLPLEHVIGWAEFCGLRIFTDAGVFVPRRRSEFLVQTAVSLASTSSPVVIDLCCGTGALGLAVATEMRVAGAGWAGWIPVVAVETDAAGADAAGASLHAADLDPAAVACARRNVEPAGGHVYAGDLFDALPETLRGQADVLICNAPYVPSTEIAFLPSESRDHEPLVALDGGLDGLAVLRRAVAAAADWLALGGVLLVETSDRQAPAMASAMARGGLTPAVHADAESGATVVTGQNPG
jgi:release factor glutamine methyltransferase